MKGLCEFNGVPDAKTNPKGMGFLMIVQLIFFQLDIHHLFLILKKVSRMDNDKARTTKY